MHFSSWVSNYSLDIAYIFICSCSRENIFNESGKINREIFHVTCLKASGSQRIELRASVAIAFLAGNVMQFICIIFYLNFCYFAYVGRFAQGYYYEHSYKYVTVSISDYRYIWFFFLILLSTHIIPVIIPLLVPVLCYVNQSVLWFDLIMLWGDGPFARLSSSVTVFINFSRFSILYLVILPK